MRIAIVLICTLVRFGAAYMLPQGAKEYEDKSFWVKSGQENLRRVLSMRANENQAKNVIIFIGDGMGLASVTAGRIFKGQSKGGSGEEYKLAFEKFPNTGLSKTYNVDKQVPDSAATATAMFSGVKCRYTVLGLDARSIRLKCDKTINQQSKLTTIADWAQDAGKDTGFVTTTRVTHATPAALYAHTNSRDWECDAAIPQDQRGCVKDIARQLVEDAPGNKFKVIMGGGAQQMGMLKEQVVFDECMRGDDTNMAKVWVENNPEGKFVTNTNDLMSIDIANTSKIMGIFAANHLPYHALRDTSPQGTPSLANMTSQAIRMLRKNENGFVLMVGGRVKKKRNLAKAHHEILGRETQVESGKIDLAHHENFAKLALREVSELEEAVLVALQHVNIEETLIIVTADHSHSFAINGYPERGNDILGFANKSGRIPYETLSYVNGPGFFYHRRNDSNNVNETWRAVEEDPNRNDPFYRNFAGFYQEDETHGGEDVAVYAIGPYSHLFRGTFEQNYIAHVIAYAGCLSNWPSHCDKLDNSDHVHSSASTNASSVCSVLLIFFLSILATIRS